MAFLQMNLFSLSLGKTTQVNVIMPQTYSDGLSGINDNNRGGNYRVLYLLHGLSDDASAWMRRSSVERYAEKYNLAVVMPNGDKSFYTNMVNGDKYFDYVAYELPFIIENMFPVSRKREDRFIAGLSMGGYGALKIALRSGNYAKCAALSAVCDIDHHLTHWGNAGRAIFGDVDRVPDEDNLFYLAEHCENKPQIFQCVGTEDELYSENLRFSDCLKANGFVTAYKDGKGVHNWEFWDEYITYALAFMLG